MYLSNMERLAMIKSAKEHFLRIMNLKLAASDPQIGTTYSGFGYDKFDRTGNLDVSKLLNSLHVSRIFHNTIFFSSENPTEESAMMLLIGQSLQISETFYSNVRIEFPFRCTHKIGYVGERMFTRKAIITEKDSDAVLLENTIYCAAMDSKNHKGTHIPQSTYEGLRPFSSPDKPHQLPNLTLPCSSKYCYYTQVTPSDTDYLSHTNSCTYVKYCIDCGTEASLLGHFRSFSTDLSSGKIRGLDVLYKGESFPGDELAVYAWEDEILTLCLNFLIYKVMDHKKPIVHCVIHFFPDTISKL